MPKEPHDRPKGDSEAVLRAVRDFQTGTEREGSFRTLVETYDSVVKSFFAKRLSSTDECLDLTQETFLRVYKGLEGYRGEAPFGAWLFRIARNVLHRRVKDPRLGRSVSLEPQALEAVGAEGGAQGVVEGTSSYENALHAQRRSLLWRAIAELPPQRRRCLILWARYDLTYAQIAAAMQLSVGTIKAHLAQAKEQLAELIETEGVIRSPNE